MVYLNFKNKTRTNTFNKMHIFQNSTQHKLSLGNFIYRKSLNIRQNIHYFFRILYFINANVYRTQIVNNVQLICNNIKFLL